MWNSTIFCASRSAFADWMRTPVKRQMMAKLATASMAQSRPQPIKATEFAVSPAVMPIAPSAASQATVSQDSSRFRCL